LPNPSATPWHLPWEGRKSLQLTEFDLHPEIIPPPRGNARRARGFINDAGFQGGSGRRPRGCMNVAGFRDGVAEGRGVHRQ